MGPEELKNALQNTNEIELTVTGRTSGRESSRPVWFVQEGWTPPSKFHSPELVPIAVGRVR
jgi:hypothetical protein